MLTRRSICTVATAIVVSMASTDRASAGVNLISQTLSTGTGHNYVFPGGGTTDYQPTTFTDAPFPNDATNHALIDQTGLHILVNQTALASGKPIQSNYVALDNWSYKKFEIRFQLDQPAAYKYHADRPFGVSQIVPTDLNSPSGSVSFFAPQFANTLDQEGLLQPGVYTFYGGAGYNGPVGPQVMLATGFQNVSLDVTVPEPGSLAGLIAPVIFAISRRTRRPSGVNV